MNTPKVIFTNIPLSKEIDWIHGFLFQNKLGWGKYIIKKHPEIKKVFSFKTESEQVQFLREYIIKFRIENQKLIEKNIEVLYDDRLDVTAGIKFADADLIGIPTRLVLSKRSLENGGIEIKKRNEEKSEIISLDQIFSKLS